MQNAILYLITVLIWGSTWLAIKFQLGVVAPEVSVAYRFLLASLILFGFSKVRGLPLRFTRRQHAFIALQGLLLFGINYILVYVAELYVTSGLVAVIFSTIIIFNVIIGAWLLKSPINSLVVIGALVGILGLGMIFWPELQGFDLSGGAALGIGLAMLSSLSASFGNIVSARNQREGIPVIQTNAYGMLYGSLLTVGIALLRGTPFTFSTETGYLASLLYLALFGSVIAFGCYLTLLGRIGADRAAYVTVLFPVIALLLSAIYEGLALDGSQFAGVGLVLLGNLIVVARRNQ